MEWWREDEGGAAVFVKRGRTPEERARLQAEAGLLRALKHPGVVELLAYDDTATAGTELRTRWVEGSSLSDCDHLSVPEILGVGAAVATTVADLHDLRVTHAALRADHVLIGPAGEPVLCSFGSGRRLWPEEDIRTAGREDVRVLVSTLRWLLPATAPPEARRALRPPRRTRAVGPARVLARHLSAPALSPRLPAFAPATDLAASAIGVLHGGGGGPRSCARIGSMRCSGTLAAAAALMVVIAVCVWLRPGVRDSQLRPAACPPVDVGCRPLEKSGAFIRSAEGRFEIGTPADVIVLGRWTCRSQSLPALVQPEDGAVWVFDRWAVIGQPVSGRLVATVGGARSLRVLPMSSGCDRLVVVAGSGRALRQLSLQKTK